MSRGKGWFEESYRHSLAAKGIKSGRKSSAKRLKNAPKSAITMKTQLQKEKLKLEHHAEVEKYSGWTNRETWAVKLHWDNNYGDYQHFTGEAKRYKKAGKPVWEFADYLKETAEDIKHNVIHEPEKATKEARYFVDDVGSFERVDWTEIAEAYYQEVEE
jgi:hypothetical protein